MMTNAWILVTCLSSKCPDKNSNREWTSPLWCKLLPQLPNTHFSKIFWACNRATTAEHVPEHSSPGSTEDPGHRARVKCSGWDTAHVPSCQLCYTSKSDSWIKEHTTLLFALCFFSPLLLCCFFLSPHFEAVFSSLFFPCCNSILLSSSMGLLYTFLWNLLTWSSINV